MNARFRERNGRSPTCVCADDRLRDNWSTRSISNVYSLRVGQLGNALSLSAQREGRGASDKSSMIHMGRILSLSPYVTERGKCRGIDIWDQYGYDGSRKRRDGGECNHFCTIMSRDCLAMVCGMVVRLGERVDAGNRLVCALQLLSKREVAESAEVLPVAQDDTGALDADENGDWVANLYPNPLIPNVNS
jgi:hypothetical protein